MNLPSVKHILIPMMERELVKRLISISWIPNPLVGIVSSLLMSKLIKPILNETEEYITQQVVKLIAKHKLKEVNNAKTDTEFTDAFTNL